MIYVTNLLTRCPVPVLVFCCLFVSEKLFAEVSRNHLKIYVNYFHEGIKTEPGGERRGPHSPQTPPRRGPTLGSAALVGKCLLLANLNMLSLANMWFASAPFTSGKETYPWRTSAF